MDGLPHFPDFDTLGDARDYASRIRAVVGHNALFDDFTQADLEHLGPFMQVYQPPPTPPPFLLTCAHPDPGTLAELGNATAPRSCIK